MSDLRRLAAIFRNPPDVVDALQHLFASWLDLAFVSHAVRDEINESIARIHRPEIIAFVVAIRQVRILALLYIHHPQVGGITSAIVLAPPHHGMAVEGKLASVR